MANKMRIKATIMVVKAIWVLLIVHQSILKNKEKNIETHFDYEDGDSDYGKSYKYFILLLLLHNNI